MPRQIPPTMRFIAGQGRLLARLLEGRELAHGQRRAGGLGRDRRARGPLAIERPAHDRREELRPVAELVEEGEMLGARRIGRRAPAAIVLFSSEEALHRLDELLADPLVLVVGQDRDGTDQAHRAPGDGERHADEPAAVLLGHEAAPRLHEPAVMDVLRAAEGLTRSRAELTLEEVGEGLLENVAGSRQIPLADPPDLNLGGAPVRVEAWPVDRRPHADRPARSSSSVMTPE